MNKNPSVEIIEQPASHSMRFRYSCEGRSAGSIMGVNSTLDDKTFPAIRVLNYDGEAVVIVSCVSTEKPFRPHPNCLIGKMCSRGVCTFDFTTKASEPTVLKFPQLGIQVSKRTEILKKLEEREFLRIDPFKTGFQHKEKIKFINLSTTRLCFQVFLKPDPANPKNLVKVPPVVSAPIYDKHRANTQLLIHDVSDYSSPTVGGKKIMIFCDKIDRKDIRIRFYEKGGGEAVVWEDWGVFKPNNVHKQVAISFKTPKYKVHDICKPVQVVFHLQRLSDGVISNSIPFQYVPDVTNINSSINTKKRKVDNSQALYEFLQVHEADNRQKSKMKCNIDPNEACGQNIAAATNFGASNLYVSNINQIKPQQSDNFQQNDKQEPIPLAVPHQQQDYQWPHQQQLHREQYESTTEDKFDRNHSRQRTNLIATNQSKNPQCEQSQLQLHQPEFHQPGLPQPQFHHPELHQPELNLPELHQPPFHQSEFHQSEFDQSEFNQSVFNQSDFHQSQYQQMQLQSQPHYQQMQYQQSQPHYQHMQQHSQPQYQELQHIQQINCDPLQPL